MKPQRKRYIPSEKLHKQNSYNSKKCSCGMPITEYADKYYLEDTTAPYESDNSSDFLTGVIFAEIIAHSVGDC